MYKKLFSQTPLNVKVKIENEDSNILIPATGFVVVSEAIGNYVNIHYPTVEVSDATLEDYQAFRKSKDKADKEAEIVLTEQSKAQAKEVKAETKRVEAKLQAQEVNKAQVLEAQNAHLAKVAQDEKDVIASLGGVIKNDVTQVAPVVEPKKSGRKSKHK